MVLGTDAFDCGIQKRLIHAGREQVEYEDGTKVYFHFKTVVCEDGTVIDDSKQLNPNKPMELIIGKKFKLEVWEKAIKTMWLGEVAKFTVAKEIIGNYPIAAKQLREYYKKTCNTKQCGHDHANEPRQHCCGFNLIEHGLGYPDLDNLLKNPKELDFIFELVKVEKPGDYKKDAWILNETERISMIPVLKESGNNFFKEKKYAEASEKYREALGFLEDLLLKEKPNDTDWNNLNEQKLPILLNFSLCEFNLNEFYSCIEHTTTILEHQSNNVKALFRRAKAQAAVGKFNEAREDFNKCVSLDPSLNKEVNAQLDYLKKVEIKKLKEDQDKYSKLFD